MQTLLLNRKVKIIEDGNDFFDKQKSKLGQIGTIVSVYCCLQYGNSIFTVMFEDKYLRDFPSRDIELV